MSGAGRVVVVTGGARGIGAAIVETFARAGDRVAVLDLAGVPVPAAAALGAACDVADEAQVVAAFDRVADDLGPPAVVVANAGILHECALAATCAADFDRVIAVNLRGAFLTAREAARRMDGGRLIFIASDLGIAGRERMAAYAASKGGVIALTRSLARELAPAILVNAIAPGPVETAMTSPATMSAEALARDLALPLGRFGRPEEIAAVARFLAGPEASFVTGQVWGVNGGSVMA